MSLRKRLTRDGVYSQPLLPAVLVFLALMVIIGVSWHTARQDIVSQQNNVVNQDATFVENTLQQRFAVYEDSLRAANGLFMSSDNVTRDEWNTFVAALDLPSRYPGIRGLGYVKVMPADQKDDFEATVRSTDLDTYTIYPISEKSTIAPLVYIVPLGGMAQSSPYTSPALGFDMYSDPIRAQAMDQAAASGMPTLSGQVKLVATQGQPISKGFLLFMPLYKKGMPTASVAERLAALDGFFYAPFVSDGIFTSLFKASASLFAFSIYDGPDSRSPKIYQSSDSMMDATFSTAKTDTLTVLNQKWTIIYRVKQEIVPYSVRNRPLSVIVGGTIFSFVLALVIYLLIQRRTRSLAYSEQKKLEEAKDELLSLASHQLRTPATAVKQYVSMVRDGFAGELSKEQKRLLQKAYVSNERQLTIVDDLLYVARVDAGQAIVRPVKTNIISLIQSVIADQSSVMKERKHTVVFKHQERALYVVADPQYVRMIIENLLSNASKYSNDGTTITIAITVQNGMVRIAVRDQGVGISVDDADKLFMKFSRIPNELSHNTSGSGIGLYLAKQLAILHGGDLTYMSRHGKGSTFTLVIPKNSVAK